MSENAGRGQDRTDPTAPTGPGAAGAPTSGAERTAPEATSGGRRKAAETPGDEGTRPTHGFDSRGKVRTTRAGAWWTALVFAAVLSVLILVFIVQNGESVTIRFLGWEGELPLAVSLLAAAVAGALVVAIPGIFRIIQLRRALTRNAKES